MSETKGRRPIVPRSERLRKIMSWCRQAQLIEHWDQYPEWKKFAKAADDLIAVIERGQNG